MTKIHSISDLQKIKDEVLDKMKQTWNVDSPLSLIQVKVGMATCGIASGAREILNFFKEEIDLQAIDAEVTQTGCLGYCYAEPMAEITLPGKEPVIFGYITKNRAQEIFDKYILQGELVEGTIKRNFKTIDEN